VKVLYPHLMGRVKGLATRKGIAEARVLKGKRIIIIAKRCGSRTNIGYKAAKAFRDERATYGEVTISNQGCEAVTRRLTATCHEGTELTPQGGFLLCCRFGRLEGRSLCKAVSDRRAESGRGT